MDIRIKKLTGLVSLLIVLLNNFNKTKRPKAIPKGSAGRNIKKFMEFSIKELQVTYRFILREDIILIKFLFSLIR